jgi:hypothetical protein
MLIDEPAEVLVHEIGHYTDLVSGEHLSGDNDV